MANGIGFHGRGADSARNSQQSRPQVSDPQWTHAQTSSSTQYISPQQSQHRINPEQVTGGELWPVSQPAHIHLGQQITPANVPRQNESWAIEPKASDDLPIYGRQNQVFTSPRPTHPTGRDGQSHKEAGPEQIDDTFERQYTAAYTDARQIMHTSYTLSGYQQPQSLSLNNLVMTQSPNNPFSDSLWTQVSLPSGPDWEASSLPTDAAPRMARTASEPYIPCNSGQRLYRQPLDRSHFDDFGNAPHLVPPARDQSGSVPTARPDKFVRVIDLKNIIQCDGNETYRKAFAQGRAAESKAKREIKRSKAKKRPTPSNSNKSSKPSQKSSQVKHAARASKSAKSEEALNSAEEQPRKSRQELIDFCMEHGLVAPSDESELANAIGLKNSQPVEFGAPQEGEIETSFPHLFNEELYRLQFEVFRKAGEVLKPEKDPKPDPSRRR